MRKIPIVAFAIVLGASTLGFGGDDPSITGDTRKGIQAAMKSHIDENTVNDRYIIYDAVTGELKKLKFDSVHKGIMKKADFYVSCADFIDDGGNKYDLDLLVVEKDGGFRAMDTIVHSINGEKRKYHLED
jgi:hypothetical protein